MTNTPQGSFVSKINDVLATRITMLVGTIWAFYAFVIFGLTPVLWPGYEQQILYWSNFLQLIFLPIITVGTTIMGRDAEARAVQDHETIQQEFALLRDANDMLHHSLREIGIGVRELLLRADQNRNGPGHVTASPEPGAEQKT
jgi:hypothetical protein